MSRDPRLFLDDIRDGCQKILRYARGLTFEQFKTDEKTIDAVLRNLAVIGEAVKRLPEEVRAVMQKWNGARSPACETSQFTSISESTRTSSGTSSRTRSLLYSGRSKEFWPASFRMMNRL